MTARPSLLASPLVFAGRALAALAVPAALGVAALLAACGGGDDDGSEGGPARLYLALNGSELAVKLVEEEPEPF